MATRVQRVRLSSAVLALVVALLALCAPAALASEVEIGFEHPEITGSSPFGSFGTEAEERGVVFGPGGKTAGRIKDHLGSSCESLQLYRAGTTDAHSGKQVAYSYCETDELLEFHDTFTGYLKNEPTEKLSVWAGAPGGSGHSFAPGGLNVALKGYNLDGEVVASDYATIPAGDAKTDTQLKIESSAPRISYFSVNADEGPKGPEGEGPPLTIDDLKYSIPATPPTPEIALEPIPAEPYEETVGRQGQTVSVPIVVQRYFGSNNEIKLKVTGLPKGVTATSGTTIAAGLGESTLGLTVAANATPTTAQYKLTAESPGTLEPVSTEGTFEVSAALELSPASYAVSMTSCAGKQNVALDFEGIGTAALTLASSGDTSGLEAKLSSSTVSPGERVELQLNSPTGTGGPGTSTYVITATNGGFQAKSTITVNRIAGTITQVSTGAGPFGLPEAPQFLQSGSPVWIAGTGLCPGSTVEFGNEDGIAKSSPVGSEDTSLTTSIPTFATSGTITVHTPAGAISAPKTLQVGSFRNTWGWPWENRGTPKYISYGMIESIFGNEESTWDGTEWPSIDARVFKGYASELIGEGSCLGMTAFIQYLSAYDSSEFALSEIESNLPRGGDDPFAFSSASGASPSLEEAISIFHFDQFSAQFIEFEFEEHEASHPPLYAIEQLKAAFQGSQTPGFDFITIQNQGSEGGGHAVVPYNLESDGSGGYYIDVYNPNRPYLPAETTNANFHKTQVDESRIHVSPDGEWSFLDGFATLWHGNSQSLVVVPWTKLPLPYAYPYPELAPRGERPEIPGISTLLNLFGKWIGASSSGAATMTQVTNAAGHTLIGPGGIENLDAATRIPHAQLHYPATGGKTADPPTAWLPDGSSYKITETGKGSGSYSQTLLSSQLDAVVQSKAQSGVTDEIGVVPSSHTVSFSGGSTKPLTLDLISSAGRHVTRSAQLTTTSGKGDLQSLALDGTSLVYSHKGPATTIELQLSTASREDAPAAIDTGPIEVGAGQKVSIAPTSWSSLGAVRVTVAGHGRSRTRLLHGVGKLHAPVRKLSLSVKKGAGLTRTLTIAGKLEALPSGSQLKYIWEVYKGSKLIAHHVLTLTGRSLRPGKKRSESYKFTAPAAGSYRFSGSASLLIAHGIIEQGAKTTKSIAVKIA
jgi:hypothetical protein